MVHIEEISQWRRKKLTRSGEAREEFNGAKEIKNECQMF